MTTKEKLFWQCVASPIGTLTLVASQRGLFRIEFGKWCPAPGDQNKFELVESSERTAVYSAQLSEYFLGARRAFDLPLDLRGTVFQQKCWQALLAIPYGETRSYSHIARSVGCAAGFRAVGQANHCNPIPIVVPCHRVVASNGQLAGYGGGLHIKRALLELEGAAVPALLSPSG
jgi:methylated-DNA-[protein]-cysteine S-methyltransferase